MTTTNKRRNLLLLTNHFPYGEGEAFLENELPELGANFESIIIVSADKNDQITRSLPENCLAYNQPITKNKGLRFHLIAQNFATISRLFLQEFSNCKNLKRLITIILQGEERLYKLRPLLTGWEPSETTIYSYWMDSGAYVAARLREENPEYKAVSRAHGCDLFSERTTDNYLPLRPYILQNLDMAVLVSKFSHKYLAKKYPWARNLLISHLGTRSPVAPAKHSSGNSPKELLSVSNLIPLKRVEKIIEGLSVTNSRWHWTHVGDGPERQKLEELAAAKLCDKPNITFEFKGSIQNEELYNHYQNHGADLFITTTSDEGGIPVSIMEAMAHGVPAIGSDVCGLPEIIDKKSGFLLTEPIDGAEIAKILDQVADMSATEYSSLSQNAHKRWEEEFNSSNCYRSFIDMLKGENYAK